MRRMPDLPVPFCDIHARRANERHLMDHEALLAQIRTALESIEHPRFYETERGFQGEFGAQLRSAIPDHLLPAGSVVEHEYQKRLAMHGVTTRPDIVIHEPFDDARHESRQEGNLAVIELKLNASPRAAMADFKSLVGMMEALSYPMAIFINIASTRTHAALLPEGAKGRIVCLASSLIEGKVQVIREGA